MKMQFAAEKGTEDFAGYVSRVVSLRDYKSRITKVLEGPMSSAPVQYRLMRLARK